MFLAFTVVRTAYANFKVIVHSNLVGGHYKLGELGIHCDKTTISTFKMLMHSNLVGAQYNFHCQSTFQTFQAFL